MGMSISLIWNGTPVFWRFDTIHDAPFISTMLSVVRFLMSVNEMPVQQPNRNKSLANAKVGIVQTDCTQRLNFIFREKASFLVVGVNVVHRKRVSRYLAIVVRRGDDVFSTVWSISTRTIAPARPRFAGTGSSHG